MKTLNANCNGLKRDCVKAQEVAKNETQMRQHLEDQLLKYRKETGKTFGSHSAYKKCGVHMFKKGIFFFHAVT